MQCRDAEDAIARLEARQAKERTSGAKWLRRNPVPSAESPLVRAIEREIADVRTWEVQYHMILALAACGTPACLPLLRSVLGRELAPMVHLAAGEALVRLAESVDDALATAIAEGPEMRLQGAVRGVVMRRAIPRVELIDELLRLARRPEAESLRYWVAAAAAGWQGPAVRAFLESCLDDPFGETRRAAKLSLAGRYGSWNPL